MQRGEPTGSDPSAQRGEKTDTEASTAMIEEVDLDRFGVVRSAVMPLRSGFTAVTGETGAGKTMVVTALQLLAGGRAGAERVRSGTGQARVEARAVVDSAGTVAQRVRDAGGDLDPIDDRRSELILARTVAANGRSRAWVGGAAVPVHVLAEIGTELITVHGQSDQLQLRSAAAQRDALDDFAGDPAAQARAACREAHGTWRAAADRAVALRQAAGDRERLLDELRTELDRIDRVDPQPDEFERTQQTVAVLQHQEEIATALAAAHTLLAGDETVAGGAGIRDRLEEARGGLDRVRGFDDRLAALADQLADIGFRLEDAVTGVAEVRSAQESAGPEALEAAADRLAALQGLVRAYGDLPAAIARGEELRRRIEDVDAGDDRIAQAEADAAAARERLEAAAAVLTRIRAEAASRLERAVERELHALAMPRSRFRVRRTAAEPGPAGADVIEFLLQANPGAPAAPIAKAASGGELSRIMLALEVNLARAGRAGCLVFDEVDAGVGGEVALEIGRRLQRLSEQVQVVAVTHLAQVAAFADRQINVVKRSDGEVTSSEVTPLAGEARVQEIARMLSGLADSDTGLAHARELLDTAARAGGPPTEV